MKYGVIHYNFPKFDFDEFLDYCVETGFEYVELQIRDVWEGEENPETKAEEVKKKLESRGLKVGALAAGNDFIQTDEEVIKAEVERMRRVCELARILGTDTLRTEGGRPKDAVPEEKWVDSMAGCLKRCVEFAEPMGIKFALDNHGLCTNDGDRQLEVIRRVDSVNVGVNLDTMNYRWFGHSLETIGRYYELLAPYVFHTHLKDGCGSRQNYRGEILGEGEIDLPRAIRALKQAGYDGVWCTEYEGKKYEPPEGYRKCLEWMKREIERI